MTTRLEHLPLTRIEGTFFHVDVDKRLFIKSGNPAHTFSLDAMIYRDTHYEMPYDLFTQKPAQLMDLGHVDVVIAKVPQLVEIAPAEMAEKYGISILDIKQHSDFSLAVDQQLYAMRQQGILPLMKILEATYQVDLKNNVLVHPKNNISLNGFQPEPAGHGARFAYLDSHSQQLVKIDPLRIQAMPDAQVVKVVIPARDQLDPYFQAMQYGLDPKTYVMKYPIQAKLQADIIPLHQTSLPLLVKNNQDREIQRQASEQLRVWHRKFRNGIS